VADADCTLRLARITATFTTGAGDAWIRLRDQWYYGEH